MGKIQNTIVVVIVSRRAIRAKVVVDIRRVEGAERHLRELSDRHLTLP